MTALQNASWLDGCRFLYNNNTDGLVDQYGKAVSVFDNVTTWGINVEACYKYCGPDKLQQRSALITYSLSLTILNRTWIRRRFETLRADAADVTRQHPEFSERVRAAQLLLQGAQQVPMRASQEAGWLSIVVVLHTNQPWWLRVRTDLRNMRRGVTFSLVAQVGMAITAWLFTIIAAFMGDLGNSITAFQVSSGSMWVWMIPVICGWIMVGTQYRSGSIQHALKDSNNHAWRAELDLDPKTNLPRKSASQQQAIDKRSDLTPQPYRVATLPCSEAAGTVAPTNAPESSRACTNDYDRLTIPSWLGFSIAGDKAEEGPIYDYARIFTWNQFAGATENAFRSTLRSIRGGKNCGGQPWDSAQRPGNNLEGIATQVAKFCGIGTNSVMAYPEWGKIKGDLWFENIVASTAAMWVQWGTTGSAILLGYLTSTKGLGCQSGSYLIYGVSGTFAWLLLVASMLFSHAAMLRYQHAHTMNPHVDLSKNSKRNGNYKRSLFHSFLCIAAVTTRLLGEIVVTVNALWLVTSSIFEYAGLYETCWCLTDYPGPGKAGWVMLFKTPNDLADNALTYWIGGVILSAGANILAFGFFYLSCLTKNDD